MSDALTKRTAVEWRADRERNRSTSRRRAIMLTLSERVRSSSIPAATGLTMRQSRGRVPRFKGACPGPDPAGAGVNSSTGIKKNPPGLPGPKRALKGSIFRPCKHASTLRPRQAACLRLLMATRTPNASRRSSYSPRGKPRFGIRSPRLLIAAPARRLRFTAGRSPRSRKASSSPSNRSRCRHECRHWPRPWRWWSSRVTRLDPGTLTCARRLC